MPSLTQIERVVKGFRGNRILINLLILAVRWEQNTLLCGDIDS